MRISKIIAVSVFIVSFAGAADEAEILKAVRDFDTDVDIDTDALIFCEAVDLDGGYTVAAFYEAVSDEHDNTTYMFLLKKSGSSYRVLELFDVFQTYGRYFEPLDFIDNAGEQGDRFFAYGYGADLAGGRSIDFDYYILYRVNRDKAERLFVGYTGVWDSYYTLGSELRDVWGWRSYFTYEYSYEYRYLDIGDEMPLLLHIEYYKTRREPERLKTVRLFRYKSDYFEPPDEQFYFDDFFIEGVGAYAEVPKTLYSDILAGMNDDKVDFLLADRARRYKYDVPEAIELYEKAALTTDDLRVKRAVAAAIEDVSFYKEDPKEAIILFDNSAHYGDDRYNELFESYPESRIADLARYKIGGVDNCYEFIIAYPEYPLFSEALNTLLWSINYENDTVVSPGKIKKSLSKMLDDDDVHFEFKVGACVDFGLLAERSGDNELAMEYFRKGYGISEEDIFRDGCSGLIALKYDDIGEHKKAFIKAIEISNFGEYSNFSDELDPIIGAYEIVDGDETLTISELAGDDEIHFEIAQFDGEGENEILIWKTEWRPPRYLWAKILEFRGDKLHVMTTIPGEFYTLKIDTGLDLKPNVFAETLEMTSSEPGSYSTMYGFYEGEYRELGKFYLGVYPRLTTPDEQHIVELEIPVYDKGRVVKVGKYVGDPDTWQYFDEIDRYVFNEEEAYFLKVER